MGDKGTHIDSVEDFRGPVYHLPATPPPGTWFEFVPQEDAHGLVIRASSGDGIFPPSEGITTVLYHEEPAADGGVVRLWIAKFPDGHTEEVRV